jgi:DNA repair protein RecO (recombination protein O)
MPAAERSFRTPALILKRRDFGEADRLLTLLTPDYGKLTAIAKGARKPTSRKTGHVELFTRVDMLINRGRTFDIVNQAEVQATYLPLRENLERGAYAGYVAELTDRLTLDEDDELAPVYNLLDATFQRLSATTDPRLAVRYFELHLLDLAGFRPELNECVLTHEPVQPRDQFFSFGEGGVVSPTAALHAPSLVPLPLDLLKLLRHMQRSPFSHVASLTVPTGLHIALEKLMLGYILHLLERQLQSVDFIRRVRTLGNERPEG